MEENKQMKKVMIVDDDKFLLDMYSIKFRKFGFDVNIAFNGKDALDKLRDGYTPDVIVLDIIMPVMDGLEFLKTFREEKLCPNAVVVVLSNQGQLSDIEKAKPYNIDEYIIKAVTIPTEVVEKVMAVINRKK
ncbi:response regulator [Candidatus Nomurabacteria bacterium]|nr:response regulator [Candidatus Nomurabacteria bacterium]